MAASFGESLFCLLLRILEQGHACLHFSPSELSVEIFLARRGIEDDVALRQTGLNGGHDGPADTLSLEFGNNRNIVDGGLISAVGNRPAKPDQLTVTVYKDGGVAVFEGFFVNVRFVIPHADSFQDLRNEFPVHLRTIERNFESQEISPFGVAANESWLSAPLPSGEIKKPASRRDAEKSKTQLAAASPLGAFYLRGSAALRENRFSDFNRSASHAKPARVKSFFSRGDAEPQRKVKDSWRLRLPLRHVISAALREKVANLVIAMG